MVNKNFIQSTLVVSVLLSTQTNATESPAVCAFFKNNQPIEFIACIEETEGGQGGWATVLDTGNKEYIISYNCWGGKMCSDITLNGKSAITYSRDGTRFHKLKGSNKNSFACAKQKNNNVDICYKVSDKIRIRSRWPNVK